LIQHVAFLVEYPGPVLCTFPEEYLSLPKELLVTVMKGHQKYFAVEDKEGKLANYFIVISNTTQNNAETVRKGAEKVIKARFEDARFYFEEDKKITLKERAEQLKKVIYHERLGTLYDKTMRISSLADFMAAQSSREKKKDISTAAAISKADLVSGIVREFPELQGIIGSYYALHDGYSDKIAKALSEQYLPGHSGDRLPETETGAILSLSDKLDNVASFFMLGLSPTGSEDPFALRRQAIGIISILLDRKYEMDISGLLDKALQPFKLKNRASVINDLIRFFEQRIEFLLQTYGYPSDSISAVMSFVKNKPLYAVKERVDAIQQFKGEPDYDAFLLAIKRINNIAPKSEVPPVNKELFAQEEETLLYKEVEALAPQIYSLLDADNYYGAIKLLQTLKEPINRFFDKVLIMDKNEEIKQNRLSLVKNIQTLAQEIADFSKLS
ncbi:MAG: glycine--tRNA ligase subunit beta, partial [Nitrospirae bacterium]|nr:glycine--tRNA ligase subunit beta [Nitrospirota bacterium]